MIVITAPTSTIGGQVLENVLKDGEAVRVIARDPSRLSAPTLERVEVVKGHHFSAVVRGRAQAGGPRMNAATEPTDLKTPAEERTEEQIGQVLDQFAEGFSRQGRSPVLHSPAEQRRPEPMLDWFATYMP